MRLMKSKVSIIYHLDITIQITADWFIDHLKVCLYFHPTWYTKLGMIDYTYLGVKVLPFSSGILNGIYFRL